MQPDFYFFKNDETFLMELKDFLFFKIEAFQTSKAVNFEYFTIIERMT